MSEFDVPDPQVIRRRIRDDKEGDFRRFNDYLRQCVASMKSETITVSPPKTFSVPYDVREEVFEAWRAKGWKVSWSSDQRDGDWILLSVKP